MRRIVLFDGICNFCENSVQFIIKRDTKELFQFASLQGETGQGLIEKHQIPNDLSSIIFIEGDQFFIKSAAALKISKHLKGAWKLLYIFIILPKPIRDFFYDIVAKNRYKWFGKKNSCMIPSPEVKKRFLD